MIRFTLNGEERQYEGDPGLSLLNYLRGIVGILSPKDGCSGQAACGACLVEMNGKAVRSCVMPMKKVARARIVTIEGFPETLRQTLGRAFVEKGAVQCGFCTPGFLTRTKILLETNPDPTEKEIVHALRFNLCRCTGYVKIVEAVRHAAAALREKKEVAATTPGKVGTRQPKYDGYEKAVGASPFVDDLRMPGMLHGVLKFSEYPRARVIDIDTSRAAAMAGVVRVFTAKDIPGERITGLIHQDWPVMIERGEITRCIGDVVAAVVAETEFIAREAASRIVVTYEEREPLTDMLQAETSPIKVHDGGNLLKHLQIRRGDDLDAVMEASAYVAEGTFRTQRVEHGFLETESAVARPKGADGVELYVQSQGVYEDQRMISRILGIAPEKVHVHLVPTGGGFGGKEDLSVQGHAAVFAHLLKKTVRVRLTRAESIRMHPKRHPMAMVYALGCDEHGKLTGLRARIVGDTGAYASVGAEVISRAAGHAAGAYHVPSVDIDARAVYTNNIPSGAMRGFGVNQVTFAMESLVDELCEKGGFDRWQFRYDNALETGLSTATGQVLGEGVGLKETLLAVKEDFRSASYAGLACGIKNTGIGNGMVDESRVKIEILGPDEIVLHHGWTEMGQGVDTVAQQILCDAAGLQDPGVIRVKVTTDAGARSGMTTASRGTALVGNAIIDAAGKLKADLKTHDLAALCGRTYTGHWACDWTTPANAEGQVVSHFSYGYATHLVVLDDAGRVESVTAAHDAGRVINPTLFEGQIQGAVVMGLGYALTEELPMENGRLKTTRLAKLGIPGIKDTPRIIVKPVEANDPVGPYGAKGAGEIGLVPTAAAVANALYQYDKVRRYELPMGMKRS